jgi:uncharacterized protein
MIVRFLFYLSIGYILFCVITYFIQRRLLYFPDKRKPTDEEVRARGLMFWPHKDGAFRAFTDPDSGQGTAGVVVVFHGNAGSAIYRDFYVQSLKQIGYRVLLVEYPGYGGRPGQISENSIVQDAKVTLRMAYQHFGKPLYVCGESLGCGVAAAVAADTAVPIAGLVLITPWDSLPALAQTIYWFLPARWLTKDTYNTIKNLASFPGRIAIAIAEEDEIIPKKHSFKLFATLTNEKRLWIIRNAGHNTWPENVSAPWWQQVMGYLENG